MPLSQDFPADYRSLPREGGLLGRLFGGMKESVSGPGGRAVQLVRAWGEARGLTEAAAEDHPDPPPGLAECRRPVLLHMEGAAAGDRLSLTVSEAEWDGHFEMLPADRSNTVLHRAGSPIDPELRLLLGRREGVRDFLTPRLAAAWSGWTPVGEDPEIEAFHPADQAPDPRSLASLLPWLGLSIGAWLAVAGGEVWAIGPGVRGFRDRLDALWALAAVTPAALAGEPLPDPWSGPTPSNPRGGHGDPFREVSDSLEAWAAQGGLALRPSGELPYGGQRLLPGGGKRYLRGVAGAQVDGRAQMLAHMTSASEVASGPGQTRTVRSHYTVVGVEVPAARGFLDVVQINHRGSPGGPDREAGVRPLQVESSRANERFEIMIGDQDDENRARQLLSPSFVDWLSGEAPDASFSYLDGSLIVVARGHEEQHAVLDRLWAAARTVAGRLQSEAREAGGVR